MPASVKGLLVPFCWSAPAPVTTPVTTTNVTSSLTQALPQAILPGVTMTPLTDAQAAPVLLVAGGAFGVGLFGLLAGLFRG